MTAQLFRFVSKDVRKAAEDALQRDVDWIDMANKQAEFDTLIALAEADRAAYAAKLRAKYGDAIAISGPGIPEDDE